MAYNHLFVLFCFLLQLTANAQIRQTADALTYRTIRTINPTDLDFEDLTFLKQEIGQARVVFLGEPTHGEGNVFEAKIRLVRFLQQQGFGTVAFESGFYEVNRAQQDILTGQDPTVCLNKSLFPIWTHSQEFQPIMSLFGKGKLKVTGFDPQLTGEYSENLVKDLQTFLGEGKDSDNIPFDYIEDVIATMGQFYTFPPTHKYAVFKSGIYKVTRQLEKIVVTDPRRSTRAEFWLQTLASINALARDYAQNDPGIKGNEDFKAKDSNIRDQLMADNLLWYLRQHPTEKIICWGANAHFSGFTKGLQNTEIQEFKPMGGLVKAAMPIGQVYLLGMTTAGGEYGNVHGPRKAVPVPTPGSLEGQLAAIGSEYLFVSLQQPVMEKATTHLFDYKPVTGNWAPVFNGVFFLKTVRPPVAINYMLPATLRDSVRLNKTSGGSLTIDTRRIITLHTTNSNKISNQLRGVVLDQKTRVGIPFANVYLKKEGVGLTTNIKGEFELPRSSVSDSLIATCLGFGRQAVAVGLQSYLTVLLPPQAYALAEVTVKGESLDPRKIMERVLQRLPQNYLQQDYNADIYARASSTNFDSLLYDVEYFSKFYDALGYRSVGEGTSRLEEVKWNKTTGNGNWVDYHFAQSSYSANSMDLIDDNPLFQANTWKKYTYSLTSVIQDQGHETLVVDFVAKKNNHHTTGDYFDQGYSGKLYINSADYAVTRCEVEWQRDTLLLNSFTRKYFARGGLSAQRWHYLHHDFRIRQTVTYRQQPSGQYCIDQSVQTWIEKHKNMLTSRPMDKLSVLSLQFVNIRTTGVEALPARPPIASTMLKGKPFNEEFWKAHQRPYSIETIQKVKAQVH